MFRLASPARATLAGRGMVTRKKGAPNGSNWPKAVAAPDRIAAAAIKATADQI